MHDSTISLLSFGNDHLAMRYLDDNNIQESFVYKEDDRRWQVMEGRESELAGFVCGEFRTKRAAKEKSDKINARIQDLKTKYAWRK